MGHRGAFLQQISTLSLHYVTRLQTSVVCYKRDQMTCNKNNPVNLLELVVIVIALNYEKSVEKRGCISNNVQVSSYFRILYKVNSPSPFVIQYQNGGINPTNCQFFILNVDVTYFIRLTAIWSTPAIVPHVKITLISCEIGVKFM